MKTILLPPISFKRDWFIPEHDCRSCSPRLYEEATWQWEEFGKHLDQPVRSYSYHENNIIINMKAVAKNFNEEMRVIFEETIPIRLI